MKGITPPQCGAGYGAQQERKNVMAFHESRGLMFNSPNPLHPARSLGTNQPHWEDRQVGTASGAQVGCGDNQPNIIVLKSFILIDRPYLGLHGFGVLYILPVLSIHAVRHFKLLHEGSSLYHRDAVSASGPLDNHSFHILRDSQVHLQPLFPWLGLGDPWEPSRAAADQPRHARGPVVPSC